MEINPSNITSPFKFMALALTLVTLIIITYLKSQKGRTSKIKFRPIFFFCCFLLMVAFSYIIFDNYKGEKENDQLEKAILKSNQALFNTFSSTSEGESKAFSLIQESVDLHPCYENLMVQSTLLKQKQNPDYVGALEAIEKAKRYKKTKALFILQGEIYEGLNKFKKSLESYSAAIQLQDNVSNKIILDGIAYFNYSGVLMDQYNVTKPETTKDSIKNIMLAYANKGINLLTSANYKSMGNIYAKRAEMYMITKDVVNASDCYEKSIVNFENDLSNKIESRYLAEVFNDYSVILLGEKEYQKTIEMADKSRMISLKRNDNERLGYAHFNIGASYLGLKLKLKACENFQKSAKYFHLSGKTEFENHVKNIIKSKCN